MRGRFIAFEGGEGVGKSTHARMLADALGGEGHKVLLTREPGGTPGAEAIRDLLLDPAGFRWRAEAEALLFAAARADHVARAIRPALDRGEWVVCDRFLDSSRAYQAGEGGLGDEDILALHRVGSADLLPDLTVLLETDPATSALRLAGRDCGKSDRIGGREAAYHARVAQRFRTLAEREPGRFVCISGEGSREEVHQEVWQAVEPLLESSR